MNNFTLYYEEQNTQHVRKMFGELDCTGGKFQSIFDNDSTGGSYDMFTVITSVDVNAYILVHNALRVGILTHYTVY